MRHSIRSRCFWAITLVAAIITFSMNTQLQAQAVGGASINIKGNQFVSPQYGNCFSPFGTYGLGAGQIFDRIEVEIKEVVGGQEAAVAAYPNVLSGTTNGPDWSSPTYLNLAGNKTYKVKVRLYGKQGPMGVVQQIATTAAEFPF